MSRRAGGYAFATRLVLALAAAFVAAAGLVAPASAAAAATHGDSMRVPRLLLADDSENKRCRHEPDAFYVPRDPHGEWFNWYCRNGQSGTEFRPDEDDDNLANMKMNGAKFKNWDEWISRNGRLANGYVDFTKLDEEPCRVFDIDITSRHNPGWDLDRGQCANVENLKPRESPCEQWKARIIAVKGTKNAKINSDYVVPAWDPNQDPKLIVDCKVLNAVFAKSWAPPPRADPNQYDRYDFSAPDEVIDGLSPILGYATWVAFATGVFGIMVCGGKLVIMRRQGGGEPTIGILVVMGASSAAASSGAIARYFIGG